MQLGFFMQMYNDFYETVMYKLETLWPKVIWSISIVLIGTIIAFGVYKLTMHIFKRFWILDLIDKIWDGFEENTTKIVDKNLEDNELKEKSKKKSQKVHYDRITAKALSYYIFLLFFRQSVVILGITDVENFMQDLINYLPSLFIWILIWYFGLRFANSVHDIIYQTMELTKDKTSRIIAMGAKIIIMFFTFMIMLNYIKILDDFIINALFLGFITTMTISFWIAFGLGWKGIAKEILEWFRK
jgi:hypothetical protein